MSNFGQNARGHPLQNSRNRSFSKPNLEKSENSKLQSDFSLIGMDGRCIYSSL